MSIEKWNGAEKNHPGSNSISNTNYTAAAVGFCPYGRFHLH